MVPNSAPLSMKKGASWPLIFTGTVGLGPTMVIGSSASLFSLQAVSAQAGEAARPKAAAAAASIARRVFMRVSVPEPQPGVVGARAARPR